MARSVKHKHGTPNPILFQEEEAMLAVVKRALSSTSNAQTIGRNGEVPLREFLNRYLPYTLRATTGHFVPPSGKLSPQTDIMILDARYPLLCQNADDSVLAMLHSVVATIEVKTRVATKDMDKMWKDAIRIMSLASEVDGYAGEEWSAIITLGFAYGCANRFDALEARYEQAAEPEEASLDISLLRLHPKDAAQSRPLGIEFHFEPCFADDDSTEVIGYDLTSIPKLTPLSDLYYRLVQDSYYTLGCRGYSFSDIGRQVMEYMSWSTCPWEDYYEMKQEELQPK